MAPDSFCLLFFLYSGDGYPELNGTVTRPSDRGVQGGGGPTQEKNRHPSNLEGWSGAMKETSRGFDLAKDREYIVGDVVLKKRRRRGWTLVIVEIFRSNAKYSVLLQKRHMVIPKIQTQLVVEDNRDMSSQRDP